MAIYGVGMEKTGTHSLAAYLDLPHQPFSEELIKGILTDRREDALSFLVPGVSNLYVHYLDQIIQKDPRAVFILTFREPLSWLRSSWNHGDSHPDTFTSSWQAMDALRKGDRSIEGCLKYWEWHNSTVLAKTKNALCLALPVTSLPLWEYKGTYASDPLLNAAREKEELESLVKTLCPTWRTLLAL